MIWNNMAKNVNNWGIQMDSLNKLFIPFLQLFCKLKLLQNKKDFLKKRKEAACFSSKVEWLPIIVCFYSPGSILRPSSLDSAHAAWSQPETKQSGFKMNLLACQSGESTCVCTHMCACVLVYACTHDVSRRAKNGVVHVLQHIVSADRNVPWGIFSVFF